MKKLALTVFLLFAVISCKKEVKKPEETNNDVVATVDDNSDVTSSDWKGSYVGILPCESSCLGVNTEIVLNADNTYRKTMLFIDDEQKTEYKEGNLLWLEENSIVMLDDDAKTQLKIDDNFITVLDKDGKEYTGDAARDYVLYKNICENKDFDEYTLKDSQGKEYMVTYGSGCDGAFVEIEIDGTKHNLSLKSSDDNTSIFENEKGIRFVEKDNTTTLFVNGKEITLS